MYKAVFQRTFLSANEDLMDDGQRSVLRGLITSAHNFLEREAETVYLVCEWSTNLTRCVLLISPLNS